MIQIADRAGFRPATHAIGQLGEGERLGEDQRHQAAGLIQVRILLGGQFAPAGEPVEARAPGAVDQAIGLALHLRVTGDLGRHDLVERDEREDQPCARSPDGRGQLLALGALNSLLLPMRLTRNARTSFRALTELRDRGPFGGPGEGRERE